MSQKLLQLQKMSHLQGVPNQEAKSTNLETCDIDGKNRHEEGMCKKPVCDEDHDRESTELAHSSDREDRNDPKNYVVGHDFEGVRRAGPTQTFCNTLLYRQGHRCLPDCVDQIEHVLGPDKYDDNRKNLPIPKFTSFNFKEGGEVTCHGTRVILKPTSAHTLNEVIVETAISTRAVNVIPRRE